MSFEEMDRQEANWQARARAAQGGAAQAFARLLVLAETRDTGQARRIAKFLASCYNGQAYPFDVFELRAVDVEISDDMLLCLDALRWAKSDLHALVPDGDRRMRSVCESWGLRPAFVTQTKE
jgi:hypothetical protein